MRCLVFALAMVFAGCASYGQLGTGGPGDARGSSAQAGPETTVIWLDDNGSFPSVGYFDVETIFSETELGLGSYVRVAALHITGMSRHALLGRLRLIASQIGANRLLIVKAEVKREEVFLYSGFENVSRYFSGEHTDADRRDETSTLRIDAIAIRQVGDLSTLYRYRPGDDWPAVYRPRGRYDRPTVYRPRRPRDRSAVNRHPGRDDRPGVRQPPGRDDRPPAEPPLPKDEPPIERTPPPPEDEPATEKPPPPPPEDEPETVEPPPPPPEEEPPSLKRPRMKTHRP